REQATKENDFQLNEDDEEQEDDPETWDGEGESEWAADGDEAEGDVKDESAAYLEFLNEEAQKFGTVNDDDDDELEEESLLETPLDKVEPYGLFKDTLM
ncbi:hypothetical protein MMC09_000231, partial [Bachmanniomyces sp. S44760]|nr:hypothetical protein [Bachmanniomyces sp. S44760]